eukprot:s2125_g11.t1
MEFARSAALAIRSLKEAFAGSDTKETGLHRVGGFTKFSYQLSSATMTADSEALERWPRSNSSLDAEPESSFIEVSELSLHWKLELAPVDGWEEVDPNTTYVLLLLPLSALIGVCLGMDVILALRKHSQQEVWKMYMGEVRARIIQSAISNLNVVQFPFCVVCIEDFEKFGMILRHETENNVQQQSAINSMFAYASFCTTFLSLAPTCTHVDSGEELTAETRHQRLWNGTSTCCQLCHASSNPCDKQRVVSVMLGIYWRLLVLKQKRGGTSAWAMGMLEQANEESFFPGSVSLLDEGGTSYEVDLFEGYLPALREMFEEDAEQFLAGPGVSDPCAFAGTTSVTVSKSLGFGRYWDLTKRIFPHGQEAQLFRTSGIRCLLAKVPRVKLLVRYDGEDGDHDDDYDDYDDGGDDDQCDDECGKGDDLEQGCI